MRHSISLRAFFVCGVAWAALGVTAAADSVTVTSIIPKTDIPEPGYSGTVEIPKFDPAGKYVLDRITIELLGNFVGSMGFENTDPSLATTFKLTMLWTLGLTRPGGATLLSIEPQRSEQGLVDPFDGAVDFAGYSGVEFDVDAPAIAESMDTTAAEDLAEFSGTGTIELPILATVKVNAWAGQTSQYAKDQWDVACDGEVAVTYTFSPIPEPLPLALLLLAGLVLRRVR